MIRGLHTRLDAIIYTRFTIRLVQNRKLNNISVNLVQHTEYRKLIPQPWNCNTKSMKISECGELKQMDSRGWLLTRQRLFTRQGLRFI